MPESNLEILNKKWSVGQKFRVCTEVSGDGCMWIPRNTYLVAGPNYVRPPAHLGEMWFVTDDGKGRLADIIIWLPGGLSFELNLLIKKHPESKYIPGFVRQEVGTAPTKKRIPKTEEGWLKFVEGALEENKKKLEAQAKKVKAPPPAPPTPVMVSVRVQAVESVRGTDCFTRRDILDGDVPVPETILLTGESRRVMDYLYDHLRDYCEREEGDPEYNESFIDGSDGIDITESNLREVMARVRQGATRRTAAAETEITITTTAA